MRVAREHLAVNSRRGPLLRARRAHRRGGGNFAVVEAYDPQRRRWGSVPSLAKAAGGGIAAATVRGRIVVVGGEETAGTIAEVEQTEARGQPLARAARPPDATPRARRRRPPRPDLRPRGRRPARARVHEHRRGAHARRADRPIDSVRDNVQPYDGTRHRRGRPARQGAARGRRTVAARPGGAAGVSAPMLSQVERGSEPDAAGRRAHRRRAAAQASQLLRLDEQDTVTIVRPGERRAGGASGPPLRDADAAAARPARRGLPPHAGARRRDRRPRRPADARARRPRDHGRRGRRAPC